MSLTDRVFIRVFRGQDLIEVFQSSESQIIIGQEGDAHLKLKGSDVSTVHTLIEKRQDGFYVCDLGSQTGTFKNGKQILDEKIESGNELTVGGYRLEFYIGLPPVAKTVATAAPAKPKDIPKPVPPPPKLANKKIETPQMVTPPKAEVFTTNAGLETFEKFEIPHHANGTYAPTSKIDDVNEYIKPSKGSVVEVTIVWGDRILDTYHFDSKQTVTIGSHPKNTIVLPVFENRTSHPLLQIDSQVRVLITSNMNGSVRVNDHSTSINDLIIQGKLQREGVGYSIPVDQSSVVRVDLGSQVSAFVRFVAPTPKPIAPPFLLFTTTEIATLLVTVLFFGILALYFTIYAPEQQQEVKEDLTPKRAVFVYDKKQRVDVTDSSEAAPAKSQPIKDKEIAKERGTEGKAAQAMPNKSKSQVKKLTTPNPGTGKGISKSVANKKSKPDSGAKSQKPDPTKMGIFSAFGSKGFQDQLSKTYSGSGSLAGQAGRATGTGGAAAVGAGSTPGTGLKDVGAGGEGTSTYGIAGIKTSGRGGGNVGYGAAGLGAKSRATIIPGGEGESFSPGIDREAIRKVVRDNQRQIQACYEKGLNKQPNLYGKVILEWVITDNGRVATAQVVSTTLNDPEVENCMLSRLRTWKFPEPPPGQEADVKFPFLLNAQ